MKKSIIGIVETQIQAMLHAVGIDAPIKNYAANLYFATYGQGGIQTTGKYDLGIAGWIAGVDPDDHSQFSSDQIPKPSHPDGVNYTRYRSPAMGSRPVFAIVARALYDARKSSSAWPPGAPSSWR